MTYFWQLYPTFARGLVFDFDPFCLGHWVDGVEALAASWYSCTRNIHLDNLETRARISLDFRRIVGA